MLQFGVLSRSTMKLNANRGEAGAYISATYYNTYMLTEDFEAFFIPDSALPSLVGKQTKNTRPNGPTLTLSILTSHSIACALPFSAYLINDPVTRVLNVFSEPLRLLSWLFIETRTYQNLVVYFEKKIIEREKNVRKEYKVCTYITYRIM